MFFNDTIAAIATPIGEGGIGIIRISGPKALTIGQSLVQTPAGHSFQRLESRRIYYGKVISPFTKEILDEVLFFYAERPRSYTAEDTFELQAHGGTFGLTKILDLIIQSGARLAEPGEFTQRAFLNGRIDLVQAESIIDLIRAKSDKAHQLALQQLSGRTTAAIYEVESDLYQILIAIEAVLDFPEEGLPQLEKEAIVMKVETITQRIAKLLENAAEGQKIREGISIVIVGRPNVGKSSLLNAFLQEERAIVTEIPGTTRDIIEAQFQLKGIPVRLVDTAGFRETANLIEQIGIAKAEDYLKEADLILWVLDSSQPYTTEDRMVQGLLPTKPVLLVINKTDLPRLLNLNEIGDIEKFKLLETSLVKGEGMERLEQAIIGLVGLGTLQVDDRPILSRLRHKQALEQAVESLETFVAGIRRGLSEDLLAVDLRTALEALGVITGKKVSAEVISGIFAQFCIGK